MRNDELGLIINGQIVKTCCDRCQKDISNSPYIKRRSMFTDFFCLDCEPYIDEYIAQVGEEFEKQRQREREMED